jgi:EmrB/QacA subfamily drug resistance transporter
MIIAITCVAQFVVVLDVTIVATALPAVQGDLGLSTNALGWVITAYTLVFGGCLLAAGRLADRVGRRRAFTAGLLLFAAASLACGLAPCGAALLGGRAVQGLGAALLSPAALALVTAARPQGRARAQALGWWTAAAAGGGASGWVLGGLLSGLLGWRWVFLVNLPLCLAAASLAARVLPEWRDPTPARPDLAGALLVTGGLAALVLALTLAATHGPLAGPTLAALVTAAALLAALARVEARASNPLLDRALLRRPGVAGPNAVAAVLTAATTPPMFFCILHAQQVLDLAPAAAGLLFPPFNLAVISGSLAGPRVAAAGERRAMAGGLLAVAAGALALRAIAPDAPALPSLLGGFLLLGGGLGVASVASTTRGTAALGPADQGFASGLLATSAQLGTALGLAIIVPIASAYTRALGGGPAAQVAGFELGFAVAAALATTAAGAIAITSLRARQRQSRRDHPSNYSSRSASRSPFQDGRLATAQRGDHRLSKRGSSVDRMRNAPPVSTAVGRSACAVVSVNSDPPSPCPPPPGSELMR